MLLRIATIMTLALFALATPTSASYETGWYAYSAGDFATARREWLPLAEGGDARSQYQLGLMELKGEGAAADAAIALKWFRLAADQGYTPSLVNLAELYYTGRGATHDHDQAASLYTTAARQGNAEAQYALGSLYTRGHGVEKDLTRAHMWLSIAGMRGLRIARNRRSEIEPMMTADQLAEAKTLRQKQLGLN